jgi:PAS domain S-box-containing protein
LILGIALVHLLLMSVFVADMMSRQYKFLRNQSRQQALSLANELAIAANTHILGNDFDGLQRVIQNYKNFPELKYAMIVGPDNEVLSHTDISYVGKSAMDTVSIHISKVPGSHILVADDQIVDAVAPVTQAGAVIAWARVAISQEYIYSNLTAILRNGVIYILVAITIGTLVGILMGNNLTRGLYKLVGAAEKIRAGDRSLRAADSENFEVGRLAVAFNQMLDDIDANESLLKNAFDFSAVGMTITDLDGRWTKVNGSLCSMLGYSSEELARRTFKDVTHPDDLDKNLENFTQLQQGKIDKYSMDKRYIHKSGSIVWAHVTVSAAKDQQGRPMFFVAQVEDITEVIESLREVRERESILQSIFQNNEGAIGLFDKDLRYVLFNRQFSENHYRMTGKYPVSGQELYTGFPSEIVQKRRSVIQNVLKGNKEVVEANYLLDGKREYYRTSFNPVVVDGEITGVTSYSMNLTPMKEAEMAILKLNRVYKFISEMNQMIVRAADEETILREACRIAIEFGQFRFAWAGVHDIESGWITPTAWAGHEDGYLKNSRFSSRERPEGNGPTGRAVRSRTSVFCNDVANDPLMANWRDDALARGYHSSITIPLFAGSSVVSVLAMYTDESFFFTETEIKLLKEVTDNISFALDKIRLRRSEERAGAELKESEEKFRTLVEQSQVGVYILQDNKFVYVNPLIERISGYNSEELLRMGGFDQIIHKDDRDLASVKYENRILGKAPMDDYIVRVLKKNGGIAYLQTIASKILYRNQPAVLGSVIDITHTLYENNRINKAVIAAQERERIQIGMELHDNVQQILAGAMLTLDFVFASYEDKTSALGALRDIKRYLNESMVELRRISHQLAPSIRFEQNLEDKIRALVETMNIGRSADVKLEIDHFDHPLSQDIQLAFYRILQEQLTNILKYAHASLISIRLEELERIITLSIKDNGKGFDPATKKAGIGLENIRRRVAALEGEMKIVSSVGNGCELLLHVPADLS